ncbi:hypothetical protein FT663_01514 [Candidozyma haemuli var. vulneris]|uniref:Chaperone DnaJ n=1 Tax=Candidozyma haemuli TaxID=45357 RepID=A0A2V1ATL0_9ASCO|nr:hypothetical protein CXQ85_000134 [[Candida] haemuloni]KAF3988922.1 hypothetical protein FT662_03155 [[Candida] haemuloni var. vulneris]KAF3994394.1 hypothetical protein FT663_01514 [[Candida] haemuloni var. vulneris]PVH21169.1 hypothetical protein CXQ85_000134 [[Candida] haemuloni]
MVYETYLYDLLAVAPEASGDEIGKAYKKLALKYHPDKTNHNPELTEKFKEATRAYEILKEPHTRNVYDAYGPDGLDGTAAAKEEQQARQNQRRRGPTTRFPFQQDLFTQMFNDMNSVFSGSPFDQHFGFFGGPGPSMGNAAGSNMNMGFNMNMNMGMGTGAGAGAGAGGKRVVRPAPADPQANRVQQGPDIQHTFKVSLADMYYGRLAKFQLARRAKCTTCGGVGGLNPRTCRQCNGSGRIIVQITDRFTRVQEIGTCQPCRGTGIYTSAADKCPDCDGGFKMEKTILSVQILPGSKNGDKCILRGMADEGRNIVPGDVVIHLQEIPHPFLVRRNNDLYLEKDIDLKTALLGGSVMVHDFINTGEDLKILVNVHGNDSMNDSLDSEIKHGEVVGSINSNAPKIVKGMGMPINSSIRQGRYFQNDNLETNHSSIKRGDLFIRFNVQIPSLDQFSSIQDIAMLSKILPDKPAEQPGRSTTHEQHLSNLPEAPIVTGSKVHSPEEYDYDRIEVDSQDSKEEEQDDIFYMGEWSKEADEGKKRRKCNSRQSAKTGAKGSDPATFGKTSVRC